MIIADLLRAIKSVLLSGVLFSFPRPSNCATFPGHPRDTEEHNTDNETGKPSLVSMVSMGPECKLSLHIC
jgi:hypothetical protein